MKSFFVLLLALNAGFMLLGSATPLSPIGPDVTAASELQVARKLTRLSELSPLELPARRPQVTPDKDQAVTTVAPSRVQGRAQVVGDNASRACARIVFDSEVRAVRVSEQLIEHGATVSLRPMEGQREAFWVFAPRQGTRKAADRLVDQLRQADIRDYYLIRAGEHRDILSLGVFSSSEAAGRRVERLRRLGVETQVEPRTISVQQYMLLVDWGGKSPLWPVKEIQSEPVSCR